METPFTNDPFAIIGEIFRSRHPDKPYQAYWVPEDEMPRFRALAATQYEDGEAVININADVHVRASLEAFICELAHLAVGDKERSHGEAWQQEYLALRRAYNSTLGAPFREVTIDD